MMKVFILAAGYGTRLERDLNSDTSRKYTHLRGIAKPLLPIGGSPLISWWMTTLAETGINLQEIFVVTNCVFYEPFKKWSLTYPGVNVVNNGVSSNETRLGAVGDLQLLIEKCRLDEDVTIIGGDTLFKEDFSLKGIINTFYAYQSKTKNPFGVVTCYECQDSVTHKHGILERDSIGRIIDFLEKPNPEATASRMACPCFYILSRSSLPLVKQFWQEKKDASLAERDATGNLIKFLCTRMDIYTVEVAGRYDVGGLDSYIQCNEVFRGHKI